MDNNFGGQKEPQPNRTDKQGAPKNPAQNRQGSRITRHCAALPTAQSFHFNHLSPKLPSPNLYLHPVTNLPENISRLIAAGDRIAYEKAFRALYAPLCAFSRKMLEPIGEDPEEIVQDYFVELWEKRQQIGENKNLAAYSFAGVKNKCLNRLQHEKVRLKFQDAVKQAPPTEEKETWLDEETMAKIQGAIAMLPDRTREVFEMSRFEGLRYAEIADDLEISIKTVENLMGKALKTLRENLKDLFPLLLILLEFFPEILPPAMGVSVS